MTTLDQARARAFAKSAHKKKNYRGALLAALRKGPRSAPELAAMIGIDDQRVSTLLTSMRRVGELILCAETRAEFVIAQGGRRCIKRHLYALPGTCAAVPYEYRRNKKTRDAVLEKNAAAGGRRGVDSQRVAGPCIYRNYKWSSGTIW